MGPGLIVCAQLREPTYPPMAYKVAGFSSMAVRQLLNIRGAVHRSHAGKMVAAIKSWRHSWNKKALAKEYIRTA
jgi:hypothetical protein